MKDSPSDGSLVQHLQPPRPSLENTLSNEPTQLMSAMSTAPGRHPQDVESNGDTHQLQLFEEAEAELIIQPEPMDPSSFTTKDTPPLVDAQPLRRRRGLVWGLVALAVAVVAIVIDVRVAVAKPTPISPAPTMSPTVNVIDSTPLMALIPELRASFSNATNVAIVTQGLPQQQAFQWLVSSGHPPSEDTSEDGVPEFPPLARLQHRFALATMYSATGGESTWINNVGWLDSNVHECDWFGWNCTVKILLLPQNGLRGTLPREISLLPLFGLHLTDNQLTGLLLTELGQSSALGALWLSGNHQLGHPSRIEPVVVQPLAFVALV